MIAFKSVGHFFASLFKSVAKDMPVIKVVVDKVLPLIPGIGPIATTIADLGFAALGEVAAVVTAGSDAAKAHLLDAGLDQAVIKAIQDAVASFGGLAQFISAMQAKGSGIK